MALAAKAASALSARAALKSSPWARMWFAAVWLTRQGHERLQANLTAAERRQLWELIRKSGGRRSKLSTRERTHFRDLVRKAIRGHV